MKVLIVGRGVSGRSAEHLAGAAGLDYMVACDGETWDFNRIFAGVELAVVSPGVKPGSPLLREALRRKVEIAGEMEFGFRHFSGRVFAVTGTNGKTTTTEMLHSFLTALDIPALAAGNIGTPLSELAARQLEGTLARDLTVALEVSSFQLEYIRDFSPAGALLLNIESDHLDRYERSMEKYAAVKKKVFRHLPVKDRIYGLSMRCFEGKVGFDGQSVTLDGAPWFRYSDTRLAGLHNLENLVGALELLTRAAASEKLNSPKLLDAIMAFVPGRHRLEKIVEFNGVCGFDDSKATNPAAVAAAVAALPEKRIRIVLGGLDKGMDFSSLRDLAPHFAKAYLIGESAPKIRAVLTGVVECVDFGCDFASCVRAAAGEAEPGEIVLLSPGCASMDMFRDYAERGDLFVRLLREYAFERS